MDFVEHMRQAHAANPDDPLAAIALGDAAEEAGNHALAASARYMAANGHVPRRNNRGEWSWQSLHDDDQDDIDASPNISRPSSLLSSAPYRLTQNLWWHLNNARYPERDDSPRLENVPDYTTDQDAIASHSRIYHFPTARAAHDAYHEAHRRWRLEQDYRTPETPWENWHDIQQRLAREGG